jgi:dTDP-4-amino-4,6-dideoxygalactose transaminase
MNSRLDTIQAAILLEKLAEFPQELISRNKAASQYGEELNGDFITPTVPKGYVSSWAQYTLVAESTEQRTEIMAHLKDQDVPSVIYYGTCMHEQTALNDLGDKIGDFPVAEKLSKSVFSLPMHPYMDQPNQCNVIKALIK